MRPPREHPTADRPHDRAHRQRLGLIGVVMAVSLVSGTLLASAQLATRHDLEQRFANRADLSAAFTSAYVTDIVQRERTVARARLSGTVTAADFDVVATDLGFSAALLLDDRGSVIAVMPQKPALIGTQIAARYDHLATAEAGGTGVSAVVPAAANGEPLVAFAVQFPTQTTAGNRVFSGGFDIGTTPLGSYLRNSLPYPGATSELIDSSGKIVASSRGEAIAGDLPGKDSPLAAAIASGANSGDYNAGAVGMHFVEVHPAGTPWRMVNSVPRTELFSALSTVGTLIPWAVLAGLVIAGLVASILVVRLAESRAQLARTALTDALTSLPNRRAWDLQLPRLLALASRTRTPICMAVLDIDHFKSFNDRFGHRAGDDLLADAARRWGLPLRSGDLLVRYGGEEFALLLPGACAADAAGVIERLRAATPGDCKVSAGYAEWDTRESAADLFERADRALYAAKAAGRNRSLAGVSTAVEVTGVVTGSR